MFLVLVIYSISLAFVWPNAIREIQRMVADWLLTASNQCNECKHGKAIKEAVGGRPHGRRDPGGDYFALIIPCAGLEWRHQRSDDTIQNIAKSSTDG